MLLSEAYEETKCIVFASRDHIGTGSVYKIDVHDTSVINADVSLGRDARQD